MSHQLSYSKVPDKEDAATLLFSELTTPPAILTEIAPRRIAFEGGVGIGRSNDDNMARAIHTLTINSHWKLP